MSSKLKKIATRLSKNIRVSDLTLQNIFTSFKLKLNFYKDYLSTMEAKDIFKITIYIYSYKKTGNFDLSDKIIPNLTYIGFLSNINDEVYDECETCEGDGVEDCPKCEYGYVDCEDCDGGYVCGDCGFPEDECECYEYEETECPSCNGEGRVSCNNCDGKGYVTCTKCEGGGEYIMQNTIEVEIFNIVTWDNDLVFNAEKSLYDRVPSFDDAYELSKNENHLMINSSFVKIKPKTELDMDKLYSFYITDEPNISLTKNKLAVNENDKISSFGEIVIEKS